MFHNKKKTFFYTLLNENFKIVFVIKICIEHSHTIQQRRL